MIRIHGPLFLCLILFGFSLPSAAQHTITGRVTDENGDPLTYSHVVLLDPADSTLQYYDIADDNGIFKIRYIKAGDYLMQYSFVAKETIYEAVTIPSNSENYDRVMKSKTLQQVVVTAEYVPIQIKSDTLEYNAKAFVTKPDAVVEDLLKKIPGIEVDKSGNMKALGEDVEKVLVDGKEFFGKDPKVATKNLPAEAVDKVQIYDKRSEEAEFMGIDDGVRDRTIDLLLNEDHKKGYFGRVEAGAGTEEHYKTGGKIYRFSSLLQSALLGNGNNVNDFGYSEDDKKDWGRPVNGRNTTGAGGLNLSYNATEYNRYFASYLGSTTQKMLEQYTSTRNYTPKGAYVQSEDLNGDGRDTPHKINFGVRHNFNRRHNLTVDGDVDIRSNETTSQRYTHTGAENELINTLDQSTHSTSERIHASTKAVHIAKLNGDDTQVRTDLSVQYNKNESGLNWTDRIGFPKSDSVNVLHQAQDNMTDRLAFSVSPTLVQRIKKYWYLSAAFNIRANDNQYSREQELRGQTGDLTDYIIPDFSTTERIVNPTLSLRRNTAKHQFNIILGASWNQLDKVLGSRSMGTSDYFYLLPGFSYENHYRKGRRINFRYDSGANMPSAQQLYPVEDTVNPLSLYRGNIDLAPEIHHNGSFSWWLFDYFSFTSLFAHVSAGFTKNKISWSQATDRDLIKKITPINVPHHYSASSYISFSTPVRALGIKVNVESHENWSKIITFINSEENIQTNWVHTLRLGFENRRKEKWDAGIGGSVSMTDARFSVVSGNSLYFNTSYYTYIRFAPNRRWNFEVEADVVNYDAESFTEAVSIPLLNVNLSYFLFEGEKAFLTLRGYDLLNESLGFRRISTDNYLMQQEWNTISRYVMLSLNWRIGK